MYAYGTHSMSIQEDLEIFTLVKTSPIYIMYTHLQVRRIERTNWYNFVSFSACFGDASKFLALSKRKQKTNRRTKRQRTRTSLGTSLWHYHIDILSELCYLQCSVARVIYPTWRRQVQTLGGVQDKLAALLLEIVDSIVCKCSTIVLLTSHLTCDFGVKRSVPLPVNVYATHRLWTQTAENFEADSIKTEEITW